MKELQVLDNRVRCPATHYDNHFILLIGKFRNDILDKDSTGFFNAFLRHDIGVLRLLLCESRYGELLRLGTDFLVLGDCGLVEIIYFGSTRHVDGTCPEEACTAEVSS